MINLLMLLILFISLPCAMEFELNTYGNNSKLRKWILGIIGSPFLLVYYLGLIPMFLLLFLFRIGSND